MRPSAERVGLHVDLECEPGDQPGLVEWLIDEVTGTLAPAWFGADWQRVSTWDWASSDDTGRIEGVDADPQWRASVLSRSGMEGGRVSVQAHRTGRDAATVFTLTVSELWDARGQLEVWCGWSAVGGEAPARKASAAETLRELLIRIAGQRPLLYGGVSDDGTELEVALDRAQRLNGRVARLEADQFLRSYSWVTFVPKRFLHRFEDGARPVDTGAFQAITELESGLALQATDQLDAYGPEAVCAVRRALSPVLRDRPTRFHPSDEHLRICWDDAP